MHTDLQVDAVRFPGEGCDGEAGHGNVGLGAVASQGIDLQLQGWLDPSHIANATEVERSLMRC
jgi:hypothetical protein